ncbi:MAG: hypothetical protein R3F29_14520 [Planctomycetota bacterium]
MIVQAETYSPGIGSIAFVAVGLILVYSDVRLIQMVGLAARMGDVVEVSPPLWGVWVRLVAVSVAVLVVAAGEVVAFFAARG